MTCPLFPSAMLKMSFQEQQNNKGEKQTTTCNTCQQKQETLICISAELSDSLKINFSFLFPPVHHYMYHYALFINNLSTEHIASLQLVMCCVDVWMYVALYFCSDVFILVVISYLQHPFDILPSTLVTMISSTYCLCHLGICSVALHINHLTKQFSSSHVTHSSLYFVLMH